MRSLPVLVVSCLARVEVPAALWRKHRRGHLTSTDAALLTADFEGDYFGRVHTASRFAVVALADTVLDRAARMTATHGLRAYDAMQLASAAAAREADARCDTFVCFEGDLRAAAAAEGFTVVPA